MNKTELIDHVAKDTGVTKAAAGRAVDSVLDGIVATLKTGDSVALLGFGTFEVKARAAREGRNPSTGAPLKIAAKKVPSFKAGKAFKDAIA